MKPSSIIRGIPNIITVSRIIFAVLFFYIKPLSSLFFIVYVICCLSDVLDGYIARKTNSITVIGSKLDSIADLIFMLIVTIKLLPFIKIPLYIVLWIVIIFVLRIISILIVFSKYKKFAILHTYLNKATGFALVLLPLLMYRINIVYLSIAVCIVAILSSVEELIINIKSTSLNRDIKGIFFENNFFSFS